MAESAVLHIPGLALLGRFIDLNAVLAAVLALYNHWGYALVVAGAWAEHSIFLGVIVPGGTLVSLGGAAARLGTLSLPWSITGGAAGMLGGSATDFWLGRAGVARFLLRTRFGPRL